MTRDFIVSSRTSTTLLLPILLIRACGCGCDGECSMIGFLTRVRWNFGLVLMLLLPLAMPGLAASNEGAGRERILMDSGWRFALGHATHRAKDFGHGTGYFSYLAKTGYGDGPARAGFDDRGWRVVNLPHDWAVEAPFDARASHSHGFKAIGPGFPERSIGWYRRSFTVPQSDSGRRIEVEFDGVFRHARVFISWASTRVATRAFAMI
jgi:beta-galactosidase